jgi:hypothetical protein
MRFLDNHQIQPIVHLLDWDTDRTGTYVSLKNYGKVVFLLFKAAGTAGDDVNIDVQQATDVSGTGAKDCDVIAAYWTKQAATDINSVGTFTETTQTAASEIDFNATSAEQVLLAVWEVSAEQLDVTNGFDCVSCNVSLDASGGAQNGVILAILCDPRFPQEKGGLTARSD